jgi:hypothetical protein
MAAEAGDVDAMHTLIDGYDSEDLLRCWTWVYYSKLLNKDLTLDRHYGIHDDGSNYDEDIGGSMHVAGQDGIKLAKLETDQITIVMLEADKLYQRMRIQKQPS